MKHRNWKSHAHAAGVLCVVIGALLSPGLASAQWNPSQGNWGKDDAAHVRVMTWNVKDHLCSTANKQEALNSWSAMAVIVASMKPDILIMQETGDNDGNGTGFAVDSINALSAVAELFLHGGVDPFLGGTVGSYVQKYDPTFDLPFIFVSSATDGFNRNIILSRWPFTDLNGDGRSTLNDIPFVSSTSYAPGGDGGIRGFQFAEIDLPDEVYAGDLVIGNAHLKAGGSGSDVIQRRQAAQNVVYFIDHWYNGGGAGIPDPNNAISDSPQAQTILDAATPVIIGGDWNEDEATNGNKGPAEWLTRAQFTGGTDGADRDRSDSAFDNALDPLTGSRGTFGGSSKLDYIGWQDSVATQVRAWIFNTASLNSTTAPSEVAAFPGLGTALSGAASDHRPVIADFALAIAVLCTADLNGDGIVDGSDLASLLAGWGADGPADLNDDGMVNGADLAALLAAWGVCN